MEKYIINSNTLAVIGIDDKCTKVVEKNNIFYINNNVKNIIEESCIYYGSSYRGRVDASYNILDTNYKVPIIIENKNNLVFFPTISADSNICIWISINEIYKKIIDNSNVIIIFKNNQKIITNLSKYSIENQMLKAYFLLSIMKDRKS